MLKLRQPAALKPLMLTQALERIGGVLLLVLITTYLTQVFHMDEQSSINLVGSYGALQMAGYLAGGFLSDRILGYRNCVLWGCLFLITGYLCLTVKKLSYLYLGLSLACVGNSLFMPSLSGFVSDFYYERDPRRNRGFIWLYLSMNIGSLVAAIAAAIGLSIWNWALTFYFCAGAAALAGIIFLLGKNNYENRGFSARHCFFRSAWLRQCIGGAIVIGLFLLVHYLLQHMTLNSVILYLLTVIALAGLVIASLYESDEKRYRLLRLIVLIAFAVIFWGVCAQEYMVVPLFIHQEVGFQYFNIPVTVPIYFAVNAMLVAIFCPVLANLWRRLHKKRREPSPGIKIAISLLALGFAMTILTFGSTHTNAHHHVNAIWVITAFVFFALGESILYPTGLSLVTLLAPKKWRGLILALWFMTVGMGFLLAAKLSKQAGLASNLLVSEHHYTQAFAHYALLAYGAGIALLLLLPMIKRLAPIHLKGTAEH